MALPSDLDDDGNKVPQPPPGDGLAELSSDIDEVVGNASSSHRALTASEYSHILKSKSPNELLEEVYEWQRREDTSSVPDRSHVSVGSVRAEAKPSVSPTFEEDADHLEGLPFESTSRTQAPHCPVVDESLRSVIVVDTAFLVASNPHSHNEQHRRHKSLVRAQLYRPELRRLRLSVGLIALLVLLGAIGTGIGLYLARTRVTGTSENPPTPPPTMSAVRSEWIQQAHLFPSTLKALDIPSSPQSEALSWVLANADNGNGTAPTVEREKQRFALAALYFGLGGPGSLLEGDWMKLNQHECNWKGIACSSEFVEAVNLAGEMRLRGSIAPEIGILTALTSLSINVMKGLAGPLPNEIGRLRKLIVLDLSKNSLSGTIPAILGNISSLQRIRLHENALQGTIPSVSQLTLLRILNLYENFLVGTVPNDIAGLTQLESLHLAYNRLTGSIPEMIGHLRNLSYVSLRDNPLSGTVPSVLGLLSNLAILKIDTTTITGTLPPEIFGLQRLHTLYLNDNQLSGSIPHVGNLTSAITLLLNGNRFKGTIPTGWAGLSNLLELQLNDNYLSGLIPTDLGALSNLKVLLLQNNRNVTGAVPSGLCQLTRDRGLNLTLDCAGVVFNASSCPCQCRIDLFSGP